MNCERICTPVPSGTVAAKRLPFYSHDGLGLGHVRRNIAIAKTRFCGYVSRPGASEPGVNAPPEDTCRHARPVVLATAGGGEDGFHMLRAFIDVAGGMPWQAVLVSGPCAPQEECKVLRAAAAEAGIAFHRFIPGLATWLPDVDVLVCMGGHNTLVEALAASVPTVCVPRTAPRQEQLIRRERSAGPGCCRSSSRRASSRARCTPRSCGRSPSHEVTCGHVFERACRWVGPAPPPPSCSSCTTARAPRPPSRRWPEMEGDPRHFGYVLERLPRLSEAFVAAEMLFREPA